MGSRGPGVHGVGEPCSQSTDCSGDTTCVDRVETGRLDICTITYCVSDDTCGEGATCEPVQWLPNDFVNMCIPAACLDRLL